MPSKTVLYARLLCPVWVVAMIPHRPQLLCADHKEMLPRRFCHNDGNLLLITYYSSVPTTQYPLFKQSNCFYFHRFINPKYYTNGSDRVFDFIWNFASKASITACLFDCLKERERDRWRERDGGKGGGREEENERREAARTYYWMINGTMKKSRNKSEKSQNIVNMNTQLTKIYGTQGETVLRVIVSKAHIEKIRDFSNEKINDIP